MSNTRKQNGFLKGYYGYKNLGDEILFFGVVKYIFENFDIKKLYVEVDDVLWFDYWLNNNSKYLYGFQDRIVILGKGEKYPDGSLLFFGGGEVLAEQRPFPYDGWNLLIKFFVDIIKGNFVLLGGLGTPNKLRSKFLSKFVIPKAKKIIVREQFSYDVAKKYGGNVELHNDFAYDVINSIEIKNKQNLESVDLKLGNNEIKGVSLDSNDSIMNGSYLLNLNTYIITNDNILSIVETIKNIDMDILYVPFDKENDLEAFNMIRYIVNRQTEGLNLNVDVNKSGSLDLLKTSLSKKNLDLDFHIDEILSSIIDSIKIYDWTKHTLDETIELIYKSNGGMGARLHFCLIHKWLDKPIIPLAYQEKISKFFG